MLKTIEIEIIHRPSFAHKYELPLFACPVSAGFPSPAEDYLEGQLDLNQHLVKHPAATFFVRVSGDSMIGAGIHSRDILIVDRSLEATNNKVVIAIVNGELAVKRLRIENEKIYLVSENDNYPLLLITEAMDFEIWGVVTNVIHAL
jgi:DNA polymerase V